MRRTWQQIRPAFMARYSERDSQPTDVHCQDMRASQIFRDGPADRRGSHRPTGEIHNDCDCCRPGNGFGGQYGSPYSGERRRACAGPARAMLAAGPQCRLCDLRQGRDRLSHNRRSGGEHSGCQGSLDGWRQYGVFGTLHRECRIAACGQRTRHNLAVSRPHAQSVTWPTANESAIRSALDQSKVIHLIIVDTSATAPGTGTPIRAPMTGW